jgi:MFS family permease
VAEEEIHLLPSDVQLWFERFAASPVEGLFRPNKEELWLHVCLLSGFQHHRKVLGRRLFPTRMPSAAEPGGLPEEQITPRLRWATRLKYCGHVTSRAAYHARVLLPTLWQGIRWWAQTRGPGGVFWRFLFTASLYNFGVFIFVLLYNLYLLDAGFQEDFLGLITSAATLGSLAGALPAAWLMRRLGLQRTMLLCFAGTGVVSSVRSVVSGEGLLVSTAFLGGILLSLWFVLVAPTVSSLTTEQKRPLGFSLFFSAGIGMGILGGLVGGRLPGWLGHQIGLSGAAQAKQAALLIGCAITTLACWPAARLHFAPSPRRPVNVYPQSAFVRRFLLAISVWALAIGAFNPFFNAYFARHLDASAARIGDVFSGSQLAQMVAVLLAPAVLRKLGLIGGIVGMQLATALALACLATGPPVLAAGALYAGYMSFQSMCEPGTYSLLMNQVAPAERSGASALNFLVIFASQAMAAAVAGAVVTRFGYPAMLTAAAAVAVIGATLFRGLLRKFAD